MSQSHFQVRVSSLARLLGALLALALSNVLVQQVLREAQLYPFIPECQNSASTAGSG